MWHFASLAHSVTISAFSVYRHRSIFPLVLQVVFMHTRGNLVSLLVAYFSLSCLCGSSIGVVMGGETREQNGEGMAKMAGYIMPGTIPVCILMY